VPDVKALARDLDETRKSVRKIFLRYLEA
jgi:hypothetical protein